MKWDKAAAIRQSLVQLYIHILRERMRQISKNELRPLFTGLTLANPIGRSARYHRRRRIDTLAEDAPSHRFGAR